MKKIRILINPIAGHGLAPRIATLVDKSGLADSYEVETLYTEYAGHARELAADAVKNNYAAVVAVGGDGTVNEVGSSLKNSETALAIIPAGSGNGLARHLGVKLKPLEALKQIANAKTDYLDYLLINNRFSVNVSGFGFDGYVAWLFNNSGKRGLSNYTKIALQEYARYKTAQFEIEMQGQQKSWSGHMLVIANASQFGNAAIIAPQADLKDGKADLVCVQKPAALQLPGMFIRLFTGKLKDTDYLKNFVCEEFTAKASRPLHLHIDGEASDPISEIHVKVVSKSLKILVP